MINEHLLDLYTDYLIICPKQTTATGLSALLNEQITHDQVTRMLSGGAIDSKQLWKRVKPMCQEMSSDDAVLIFDDSIQEKPYTDVNGLVSWHFDHTRGRSVDRVASNDQGNKKYKSAKTKNEYYRDMVLQARDNIYFRYVLNDSWYSSSQNMNWVKQHCRVDFIMAIKENRKVALSKQDKQQGHYTSIKSLKLEGCAVSVYVEQLDFPLLVTKQVFKNGDGSTGALYLACSDQNLTFDQITTIYKKRWKVEQYHKSLKSNTAFGKSPTHTINTQISHFIASLIAFVKLERLQVRCNQNHFALKNKIWIPAAQQAWLSLKQLSTPHAA